MYGADALNWLRVGVTRLSECVIPLQRSLFWPPDIMMRILSCLIRISHCPGLLPAMLAAHSAVDYKYWMLSRWATLKSPSTLLSQRTTPSFRVFFPRHHPLQVTINRLATFTHSFKQNAIHSPHIHNHGLQYVGFFRGWYPAKESMSLLQPLFWCLHPLCQ